MPLPNQRNPLQIGYNARSDTQDCHSRNSHMPPLLTLKNVSLSYGHVPLLDGVDLALEAGERVCLVGRNGTGKSSLLRLIYGETVADDGEVWRRDGLRLARLEQDVAHMDVELTIVRFASPIRGRYCCSNLDTVVLRNAPARFQNGVG